MRSRIRELETGVYRMFAYTIFRVYHHGVMVLTTGSWNEADQFRHRKGYRVTVGTVYVSADGIANDVG